MAHARGDLKTASDRMLSVDEAVKQLSAFL
jgi:hypothetical protein